uniref:Uncharacterized protein n=1 Tax=Strongyloides papillosus TaxID=174720 RepID=A0A0N5CH34_STREA
MLTGNFSNTMDRHYLYKLLFYDKKQVDNFRNSIIQLRNLDVTQDDNLSKTILPTDLSTDKVNINIVDSPFLTSLKSSNSVVPLPIVDNVPSYVKLDSQLSVEQYVKENDISIVCATEGSCESRRGLACYTKYPKGK